MTDAPSLDIKEAALALAGAESDRHGIAPLTQTYPGMSVADAYRIQRVNIEARLAAGEHITGRKIGLTSRAMQRQLGVDQPDYGAITDALEVPTGSTLHPATFVKPRLEAEFAFKLDADLPAEPSYDQVRSAIGALGVAFEVIDSRIADWKITLPDTVADNASMARVVWGQFVPATQELLAGLPDALVTMTRDGAQVAAGPGSAVLGDPVESVHWLATELGAHGDALRAGDKVLSGAVDAAVDFEPGSAWKVTSPGFPVAVLNSAAAHS